MSCPLCVELTSDELFSKRAQKGVFIADEKTNVLQRTQHFAVIFNRYPYKAGHLMVVALDHIPTISDLTPTTRAELMEIVNTTQEILLKTLNCDSINIGINQGKWSGASIPEHLHVHLVPRYPNDTGFYTVLAGDVPKRAYEVNAKIISAFKN